MTTIKLPLPPSTNSLFANIPGKGRVKTEAYRVWLAAAGWDLARAHPQPIKGEVTLEIIAGRPDKRRRDVSNLIKAVEDLLVKHQVIEDDSKVEKLSIAWANIVGCQVTVMSVAKAAA